MTTAIQLTATDGEVVSATANVVIFSSSKRLARGSGVAFLGLLMGVGSLPIPLWHLIGTWAFPLMGAIVGRMVYQVRGKVDGLDGHCTACDTPIALAEVGAIDTDDTWIRCESCNKPWRVVA